MRALPGLGLAVLLAWRGAAGSGYEIRVLTVAGAYGLAAVGYQFIFGQAGALALCQATFMGTGAYVSALLALRGGVPFDLSLLAAAGVPVLLAVVVAAPVLRLRTHYFALATLVVAQLVSIVVTQAGNLTGGANGLGGVPPVTLAGFVVRPGWPLLAVVWGFAGAGAVVAAWLGGGRLGRAWACVRTVPAAAAVSGLDAGRLRLLAFVLSAGYAGVAGALYVHTLRVVSPDVLSFPVTVTCLVAVVIGSRLRPVGALIGAVAVVGLPEWVRPLRDSYLLAYGVLLGAVVVVAPAGLLDTVLARAPRRFSTRGPPHSRPPHPRPPRTPAESPVLDVTDLSVRFGGVAALAGVSLQIRAGEAVGLIGPNGSGKTTLVNVLSGLQRPGGGRVRVAGAVVSGLPPHRVARAGVARTFQTPALAPALTAAENVAVACGGDTGRAAAMLDRVGVSAGADVLAASLPDGTRRRVEIARALAADPALLLLDEPAAGLDDAGRADLSRRLQDVRAGGVALLVIDHDTAFLQTVAGRFMCLEAGRVIADGPPGAVLADPAVMRAFLGE